MPPRMRRPRAAPSKSGATLSISQTDLETFANQQVSEHGFNPAGTTSVVVHHPPISGAFTGDAGYVEVIVSEPTSTFFGKILGLG